MLISMAMGGQINYWQAFSVAVYGWFPVIIIKAIANSIILFLKDPVDIHPILGQGNLLQDSLNVLVNPADHPVLFTLLGAFSLTMFYWLWLNSTGLKNAGEKVSSSAAWTSTIAVYAVFVILGLISSYLFAGFLS